MIEQERNYFHRLCCSGKTAVRLKERLSVVFLANEGLTNSEIVELVPMNAYSVSRGIKLSFEGGLDAITRNRARSATMNGSGDAGHANSLLPIIEITTTDRRPGKTHWSTRTLAAKWDTSAMYVSRVWRDNGLKPHLIESLRVSDDPNFEEKLADVVGMYLNTPDNAAVFCVGEKSAIQTLDRSQSGLPLK